MPLPEALLFWLKLVLGFALPPPGSPPSLSGHLGVFSVRLTSVWIVYSSDTPQHACARTHIHTQALGIVCHDMGVACNPMGQWWSCQAGEGVLGCLAPSRTPSYLCVDSGPPLSLLTEQSLEDNAEAYGDPSPRGCSGHPSHTGSVGESQKPSLELGVGVCVCVGPSPRPRGDAEQCVAFFSLRVPLWSS